MYTIKDATIDCLIAESCGALGTKRGDEWWGGFSGSYRKLPYRTRFIGSGSCAVVSEVAFVTLSAMKREVTVAFPLYRDNSCSFSKQDVCDYAHPIKMWFCEYESWSEHPRWEEREAMLAERMDEIMVGTIDVDGTSLADIAMLVAYIER